MVCSIVPVSLGVKTMIFGVLIRGLVMFCMMLYFNFRSLYAIRNVQESMECKMCMVFGL